ncbi:MAG: DUF4097 family beta strand repeat-containing protein [Ignavibacteriales bacterium]|nr:DUF4097 family beta strand repeat-containing protein [Ignavibacteriales bacterium]
MSKATSAFSLLFLLLSFFLVGVAQDSREVRKSGEFSQNGRLSIDTYKGSIKVISWEKPEIEIVARIEADGWDHRSREKVEDTEVRIDLSSHSAHIKTNYDRLRDRHRGFLGISFGDDSDNLPLVHYTVKVPKTTNVDIKDYKSRTEVNDFVSDVNIETYKGEVEVGRLGGSLSLNTYKGEVKVGFARLGGKSRFETYKGSIDITLPRGKGFELDADIGRHASFDSDFPLGENRRQDRRRDSEIRSAVNGGGPLVRLKTDHGTIRLLEQ